MVERRTDLALEAHELRGDGKNLPGVESKETTLEGFPLTTVCVTGKEGVLALGKPEGVYHTLDLTGLERREQGAFSRAIRALKELLCPLIPEKGQVLVVGLGNRAITPDAIGPFATDHTLVTRHLLALAPEQFATFRPVAALAAGVLGTTGVESGEIVRAVEEKIGATAIIAVDALAARRVERLCATVQVCDTGIAPGSGVGNHRFALNQESLGVPVIAVGVPTVVEGATLAADLWEAAGSTPPSDFLSAPGGTLLVTPRDIDQRVADLSKVIGFAITLALQPELTLEELELLLT